MESFGEPCRDRNEPSQSAIAKMEGRALDSGLYETDQEHRLFDFTQNSGYPQLSAADPENGTVTGMQENRSASDVPRLMFSAV